MPRLKRLAERAGPGFYLGKSKMEGKRRQGAKNYWRLGRQAGMQRSQKLPSKLKSGLPSGTWNICGNCPRQRLRAEGSAMKRLPERLTEQEFTIGQFAFPVVEEICSLRLETIGFVLESCLPH
jgi:hypothetical protein